MKNQIRYCMVMAWTLFAIQLNGAGVLFLQNGDQVDAELVGIVEDRLDVRMTGQEEVVDIVADWPFMWTAGEEASQEETVPENVDVMTLTSGQEFYGELRQIDEENILFMTDWGQEIELPRNQVSTVELQLPFQESLLKKEDWRIFNHYEKNQNVKSEWVKAGNGFFHISPRGHLWRREYNELFTAVRVEVKLYFPAETNLYTVVAHGKGTLGQDHSIRITKTNSALKVYDSEFIPRTVEIPLKGIQKEKGATHHLVIDYDYKQREIYVYFNGKLEDSLRMYIENEGDQTLKDVRLDLHLSRGDPVVVQKFGIFPRLPLGNQPGAVAGGTAIRFSNGDELDGPISGYREGALQTSIAGQPISLPKARIAGLNFAPLKKGNRSSTIRVSLHDMHPALDVSRVEMADNERLRLFVQGIAEPILFPVKGIRKIEWPVVEIEPPGEEVFRLTYGEGTCLSGELKEVSEDGIRLQPMWSATDLKLPLENVEGLVRVNDNGKQNDEKNRSTVVLRNGDYLTGSLAGLGKDAYRFRNESYAETHIDPGHLRLVVQEGEKPKGSWVYDPLQAVSHIKGSKNALHLMPGLNPEGDMMLDVHTRLKGNLPLGDEEYHMYLSLKEAKKFNISIQFGRAAQAREISGLTLVILEKSVDFYTANNKKVTMPIKNGEREIKTLEIFFDPSAKRLKLFRNGEMICDKSGLNLFLVPSERHYNISGLVPATVVEEFWIKPIQDEAWTPVSAQEKEKKNGVAYWSEGRMLGLGSLESLKEGGIGFRTPAMNKTETLQETADFGLRFYDEEPYNEYGTEHPVILQLQDQVTRLRGTSVAVTDGVLRFEHPAFPDGFAVPVNEVRAIYWKMPDVNPRKTTSIWGR